MIYLKQSDAKKILFVHMPKAGGQSVINSIYHEVFKGVTPKWLYVGNPTESESFAQAEENELASLDFIGGHISLQVFKEKLGASFKSFFSFCVLRDPIERAASLYFYIKSEPAHFLYEDVKKMTMLQFVNSPLYPANHQCHLIKHNSTAGDAIKFAEENLDVLGFFDEMPAVFVMLRRRFKTDNYTDPVVNVTPGKNLSEINDDVRISINRVDSQDVEMFHYFKSKDYKC